MAIDTPTQHHESCANLLAESSAQRFSLCNAHGEGLVLPMLIQPQLWLLLYSSIMGLFIHKARTLAGSGIDLLLKTHAFWWKACWAIS